MDNVEILQGTAKFVTAYGYVGVSLLLMGIGYIFYRAGATIPFVVTGTIGLSFLVIFAGLDFLTRNFPDVVIARPPLLIGRVTGATTSQRVLLQADDDQRPFLKAEFDPNDNNKANHLFIFSRAAGVSCIQLSVNTVGDPSENVYAIPVTSMPQPHRPDDELFVALQPASASAPPREPMLRWMRGAQRLTEPVEATKLDDSSPECAAQAPAPHPAHTLLQLVFPTAFAQTPASQGSLEERLGSADPFVRRQARQTVARGVSASPDVLINLLQSPNEQTQIGGLVTIAGLPADAKSQLPAAVWANVDRLRQQGSPAVRKAAEQARSGT